MPSCRGDGPRRRVVDTVADALVEVRNPTVGIEGKQHGSAGARVPLVDLVVMQLALCLRDSGARLENGLRPPPCVITRGRAEVVVVVPVVNVKAASAIFLRAVRAGDMLQVKAWFKDLKASKSKPCKVGQCFKLS